jgi:pre-rRNA-processing protein IPI3
MSDIIVSTSLNKDGSNAEGLLAYLWDLRTGTILNTFKGANCESHAMDIMINQEKKQNMMVLINGHMIHIYFLGKETIWKKYPVPYMSSTKTDTIQKTNYHLVSIKITPSMKWLYAGSSNGKIFIWQLSTGNLLRCFDAHYKKINKILCIHNDFVITAGEDSFVHIWNLAE